MKIAVIGAGYAGLAVTWFLLQNKCNVIIFDGGEGASHVSTGLLHPAPGKRAIPSWRAEEGMKATVELLEIASVDRPVFERNGILRIATTEEQKKDFGADTLWIPEGITVYSRLYLEGLKKVCRSLGAQVQKHSVEHLDELADFDAIVLAAGADTLRFADLPMKTNIGQCLICRWKERLPHSLLSSGHITPTEDPQLCQVGSTYEHTKEPDPKKALELLDKVALFYPPAKDFEVVEIRSGVRIAPKVGYIPFADKIAPKVWALTGLGSRGLLYHAMFAKSLCNFVVNSYNKSS